MCKMDFSTSPIFLKKKLIYMYIAIALNLSTFQKPNIGYLSFVHGAMA